MMRLGLFSASRGIAVVASLAVIAPALAGCEMDGAGLAPQTSVAGVTPAQFRLPPNAPCSSEISRYQSVVASDLQTGNVEQKVYDQIERELQRASAACSAGHGGEAHAIVASSKARHGYRA